MVYNGCPTGQSFPSSTSSDAGETWSDPVVASVFNETEFRPRTTNFRFWASAFPQIASGPEGEVYIAYVGRPSDKPSDDGDVFLTTSLDPNAPLTLTEGGIIAAGYDVCFIHPKGNDETPRSGEGVLIELVQAPPEVREAFEKLT